MTRPWSPGAATGVGSLPGTDPHAAVREVFAELPLLPHLPELPARGAGADMIGRTAALLAELPVEIQPSGWRLTGRPGRDQRRARDFLSRDLDALEAATSDYRGPLKLQVTGPWTMAAWLELPTGHRVVSDHGAVRDLAESLAEGIRTHVADVARRVPGAVIVVQLDEPSLPDVLAARVKTASGFGNLRAIAANVAEQTLADVLSVVADSGRVVHCCADDVPIELLRGAGANALSIDATKIKDLDPLGEAVDAGVSLWLGVVPSVPDSRGPSINLDTGRAPIMRIWTALGFDPLELAGAVVPTPTCGLAGASPEYARRAMSVLRDVGRSLTETE